MVSVQVGGDVYFYPRSPCGERPINVQRPTAENNFYPRSPCGERPGVLYCHLIPSSDFYPRSPCGERRGHNFRGWVCQGFLSTLSLRRATGGMNNHVKTYRFLSTLSLRRATIRMNWLRTAGVISIHALLAESDSLESVVFAGAQISIHALLAESDAPWLARMAPHAYFYPRSPCGERQLKKLF